MTIAHKTKTVIILGSSRSDGETYQVAQHMIDLRGFDLVDLKTKNIAPFDYEFKNQADDFLPTIRAVIADYDTIIFATPVYWYSMSGTMKIFFDRISDLLDINKETGRKLRGKNMAMLSCASDHDLKPGFTMPFIESANYLGMNYLGDIHAWIEEGQIPTSVQKNIDQFLEKIPE